MLSDDDRRKAAEILLSAEECRTPALQLTKTFPDIQIADSYAISSLVTETKIARGDRLIGHKIGLTSKAMQASSQIDEPDYGHLLESMLLNDGAKVRFEDYCVPRVEPELTFILKEPLKGPGIGLVDVLRATEWVVPSIEIIDARVQNPRKIQDTVADNGAAAGIVLGGRPVRPDAVDLRWVGAIFYRNAEIEETGLAAGVLGHPAMAIAWLANKVGRFGTVLEPGHLMLSGSFTRPVWAAKGDTLHADFGPLGSVSVQFV
ncbi:fumarylacetoacetate hydrolase family protein [Phreatobacter cathodiphilus]|uniref:2-oxo-hepta-3-ene-1,7-dioate hydratase n=1 Tax=Phreatobacter cathodiphilus TaxID=1868589 RepID=A0A2S0NCS5_9HYPH|nr:fumarylacetoacetate hydrolase family protein [Phreatobacter cathodiphilus]AVO45979.1 2-oxo-hepta-3-ene-1,7-dioate hydratase [Phreatobacter cathodiphilus]